MGLFDWFTSLFSSKNDEENKASENTAERDNDNEQLSSDSRVQDAREIASEKIESEIQIQTSGETIELHNNDETQKQV